MVRGSAAPGERGMSQHHRGNRYGAKPVEAGDIAAAQPCRVRVIHTHNRQHHGASRRRRYIRRSGRLELLDGHRWNPFHERATVSPSRRTAILPGSPPPREARQDAMLPIERGVGVCLAGGGGGCGRWRGGGGFFWGGGGGGGVSGGRTEVVRFSRRFETR